MSRRTRKRRAKRPKWLGELPGQWKYHPTNRKLTGSFGLGSLLLGATVSLDPKPAVVLSAEAARVLPQDALLPVDGGKRYRLTGVDASSLQDAVVQADRIIQQVMPPSEVQLPDGRRCSQRTALFHPERRLKQTLTIAGRGYPVEAVQDPVKKRCRVFLEKPFPPGVASRHVASAPGAQSELLLPNQPQSLQEAVGRARRLLEDLSEISLNASIEERAALHRLGWVEQNPGTWVGSFHHGLGTVAGSLVEGSFVQAFFHRPPKWVVDRFEPCLSLKGDGKYSVHVHSPATTVLEALHRMEARLGKEHPAA